MGEEEYSLVWSFRRRSSPAENRPPASWFHSTSTNLSARPNGTPWWSPSTTSPTAAPSRPIARDVFETLSYSNKRGFTVAIDEAKTPETRQRRIDKAVASLADQQPG
ncbi:YdeI/OmpD-associated family protein [Subtercola sp. RTI3]|uniref:YdeI/OmpD-associated family protein n=1 Tax=Subtercola sp. RTI3 TaxID=3048639 RepID=UPI0023515760|nr:MULTISPECIES: YdeI/OmpD-associated family protein [Subtercola]MEA9984074.1 YdeI/OmpD-associated family protein [Subtercola sp. RTI3]